MKIRIFALLALAGILAMALTLPLASRAAAQTMPPAPRVLSMNGEGEVKAVPDMAQVNAGVITSAPTAAGALAANSTRMQAVFAAIRRLGVAEKDIQTTNFSVSPQYTNGADNTPPRLTGYRVNNEVSVRLQDVSKLGAALDALVTAGANQMNGISFGIKDTAPLLAQARADAVADARARAETYAKAAGVTLGPILSISENGAVSPRPYMMETVMVTASRKVPVAAGEQSVSSNVSIVWEIH